MRRINATILPVSHARATIGVAFVAGMAMALASHQTPKQPTHVIKATSSITRPAASSAANISGDPQAVVSVDSTQSSPSSKPSRTPTTPQKISSSAHQQARQSTPTSTLPLDVIAMSATVSDFSDPTLYTAPNALLGTTVQYRCCISVYSDGSTQQRLYQAMYSRDRMSWYADPTVECTIANAPAVS